MGKITKKNIIDKLLLKHNINPALMKEIVNEIFNTTFEFLKDGERIELRNFGTFEVKERKGKVARNPKTNEPIKLGNYKTVVFKQGKLLKEKLNQ